MLKVHPTMAALFAWLVAAGAAQAATLTAGTYGVSSYYLSAVGAGGGTCNFPQGTSLTSEYTYPGPAKAGAASRTFLNGATFQYVMLSSYPTTPPKGAKTWSGNITTTFLPGGTPNTGTFSSNFTVLDSSSYIDTTTYVYPVSGGTCTSVVQDVGIWTGK
jgi:hypothetical protein